MRTLILPLDTLGPEARPEIPNLRFPPGVANARGESELLGEYVIIYCYDAICYNV
jgi:hypothetical protein